MNILFAYDYKRSGTESVILALIPHLRKDHTVDLMAVGKDGCDIPDNFDYSLCTYDFAHFWNARAGCLFQDYIEIPYGVTIHGVLPSFHQPYFAAVSALDPQWIHVMDTFTQQRLGQYDFASFVTPQPINREGWSRLPHAPEFSVGCLYDSTGIKRHEVVEYIGEMAGVPVHIHTASDRYLSKDEVKEFFGKISVYVNAAWGACGPVTAQEAMLCGRPVLTTPIDTMKQVIHPNFNGEFFDGTATDGVVALNKIRDRYEDYSWYASESTLNDPAKVAKLFMRGVKKYMDYTA